MKKSILSYFSPLVLFSCSSTASNYEQVITSFLQTQKGVKTDLKIEFLSMEVSDITVSDSTTILQSQYELEKAKKLESAEKSVAHWKNKIEEQKGKKNQVVAKALISNFTEKLAFAETELEKAKAWKPDYLSYYQSRNASEVLAKKADCKFTFFNPKLQTRQEVKSLFILSSDGKQCNNMIKQQ